MKVLMINTVCGYGSTGSICVDIANALLKQGHECHIAYGQGSSDFPFSYKIGGKLENHLHNLQSRVFGKQGYYSSGGTEKLIDYIEAYSPEVIHLHNLHGNYLNFKILFKYLNNSNKKIFWTFHDCWPFTGKCAHYTAVNCYKWETHCEKCPQVKAYPPSVFLDRSSEMFKDKKNSFTIGNNINIITVSDWLKGQVEKSFFKNKKINRIYNWVDHEIFKISSDTQVIDKYELKKNVFTVICVSASWLEGDSKYNDFIQLSKLLEKDIQIILVGKVANSQSLSSNIKQISYIDNKTDLAALYSFANIYIHLSSEDTFGKVIAEALSCGTPAIVYDSTACPEIVDDRTGIVVKDRDVTAVANAIMNFKDGHIIFDKQECRNRVLNNYDIDRNIQETINLYKQ